MSRRKAAPKRKILPDPKYKSELVAKFVNCMMLDGKKSTAESAFYKALSLVAQKLHVKDEITEEDGGSEAGAGNPVVVLFDDILNHIRPTVEVRSRRVGGATYQVPVEVRAERSTALAMRWLIKAARERREKGFAARLAAEMLDAHQDRGAAYNMRDNVHRMAKANQAFAHYRW